MKRRFCFLLFSVFCTVAYSNSDKPVAGTQMVEMEGRGVYITSPSAVFDSHKTLTLNAPAIDWLGDMKKEHLDVLDGIDLRDIPSFAATLDTGFKKSQGLSTITLTFVRSGKKQTLDIHDPVIHISSQNGNIRFSFKEPVKSIPEQTMEQVTLTVKTWHLPTVNLGRFPMHAVCCNCSGGCAALWILFAWCNTCLEPSGGEFCCQHCHMPAAPGETCP
ncbi:hypothetical protein GCM10023116_33030 [Kistimonas scapharcae]|uniref:Uncharacterized protein n=1 Tax=Kistimonas scapharcae TaxID=1036133 RepID=A0ABP8V7K3_9GAMM